MDGHGLFAIIFDDLFDGKIRAKIVATHHNENILRFFLCRVLLFKLQLGENRDSEIKLVESRSAIR